MSSGKPVGRVSLWSHPATHHLSPLPLSPLPVTPLPPACSTRPQSGTASFTTCDVTVDPYRTPTRSPVRSPQHSFLAASIPINISAQVLEPATTAEYCIGTQGLSTMRKYARQAVTAYHPAARVSLPAGGPVYTPAVPVTDIPSSPVRRSGTGISTMSVVDRPTPPPPVGSSVMWSTAPLPDVALSSAVLDSSSAPAQPSVAPHTLSVMEHTSDPGTHPAFTRPNCLQPASANVTPTTATHASSRPGTGQVPASRPTNAEQDARLYCPGSHSCHSVGSSDGDLEEWPAAAPTWATPFSASNRVSSTPCPPDPRPRSAAPDPRQDAHIVAAARAPSAVPEHGSHAPSRCTACGPPMRPCAAGNSPIIPIRAPAPGARSAPRQTVNSSTPFAPSSKVPAAVLATPFPVATTEVRSMTDHGPPGHHAAHFGGAALRVHATASARARSGAKPWQRGAPGSTGPVLPSAPPCSSEYAYPVCPPTATTADRLAAQPRPPSVARSASTAARVGGPVQPLDQLFALRPPRAPLLAPITPRMGVRGPPASRPMASVASAGSRPRPGSTVPTGVAGQHPLHASHPLVAEPHGYTEPYVPRPVGAAVCVSAIPGMSCGCANLIPECASLA